MVKKKPRNFFTDTMYIMTKETTKILYSNSSYYIIFHLQLVEITQKSIARLLYKIVNQIYNFIRKSPFSVKKDKKHFYTIVFYPHRIKFIFTPWLFIRMQKIPMKTSSFGHFYRYEKHIEYVFYRFGEVVVEEEVVVALNHLALEEIM